MHRDPARTKGAEGVHEKLRRLLRYEAADENDVKLAQQFVYVFTSHNRICAQNRIRDDERPARLHAVPGHKVGRDGMRDSDGRVCEGIEEPRQNALEARVPLVEWEKHAEYVPLRDD